MAKSAVKDMLNRLKGDLDNTDQASESSENSGSISGNISGSNLGNNSRINSNNSSDNVSISNSNNVAGSNSDNSLSSVFPNSSGNVNNNVSGKVPESIPEAEEEPEYIVDKFKKEKKRSKMDGKEKRGFYLSKNAIKAIEEVHRITGVNRYDIVEAAIMDFYKRFKK